MAGLWGCLTLSRGAGEEVRWSILAGVLALLGRAFGVDGLPRADGGLGEAAGLGEAVLPLGVAGDAGRCLDKGLGLEKSKNKSWRMENCVNSSQRCSLVPHYLFRPGLKCLKWHVLKKLWHRHRISAVKALKHCIMPYSALSVSIPAMQHLEEQHPLCWRFFPPLSLWRWLLCQALCCLFVESKEIDFFFLLFYPFCHGCHLFWDQGIRG